MNILSNLDNNTLFSIATFVWAAYTYFHGEKTKKEVEKIKGEQGERLESFKIFTKQKHERVVAFYESLCTLLGGCDALVLKLFFDIHPDFNSMSLSEFQEYVKNSKILSADEIVLIRAFMHSRNKKVDTFNLEKELYKANYNKYVFAYNESNSKWIKLKLYISPEDEKIIGEFFSKVRTMYCMYLHPELKDKGIKIYEDSDTPIEIQYQKYCDELTEEMSVDIIPILRKYVRK